jgi:NAD-dependent DNA ligase
MPLKDLNKDGQPLDVGFCYHQNRQKALYSLVGILDGIRSDGLIDEIELTFLDVWMKEHASLSRNRLFKEVERRIFQIRSDGQVTKEELSEFKSAINYLIENFVEITTDFYSNESDKEILIGLCKGIDANRKLLDPEIGYLNWWIKNNSYLQNSWPGSDLHRLLARILADGVVTNSERAELQEFIRSVFGDSLSQGAVTGLSTTLPVDRDVKITFKNRIFCLTGKFLHGPRKICETKVKDKGGLVSDSITRDLSYLVIGTLSSRDWKFSSHGRKIEKAIEYRDAKGVGISIVSEEMWLASF